MLTGGTSGGFVADDFDQDSASDRSTLPPPYSSHFEERHGMVLSQTLPSDNTLTIASHTAPRTFAEGGETPRLMLPGRNVTRGEHGQGFEQRRPAVTSLA